MAPFEEIRHVSEPVVTVAIEPKRMADLPKLIETMRKIAQGGREPPGRDQPGDRRAPPLGDGRAPPRDHPVPDRQRLQGRDRGVEADRRLPGDRQGTRAGPFEGKSPNKHNKFYFEVEAAPGRGRPGDQGRRDPPGKVVQGHEDARRQARRARRPPRRGPRHRRRRGDEHPVRRHEGDPVPQRDDGPHRRRVQGGR